MAAQLLLLKSSYALLKLKQKKTMRAIEWFDKDVNTGIDLFYDGMI